MANTVFIGQTDTNIGDRVDIVAIFISYVQSAHARVHDPCFSRRFRVISTSGNRKSVHEYAVGEVLSAIDRTSGAMPCR